MTRLLLAVALLALPACGAAAPDTAAAGPCAPSPRATDGPLVLQERSAALGQGRYPARTDGPCALVLAFVGAPEGEGPCDVAEYAGRVEPDGQDLRLVVEARHTGVQDDGSTGCTALGQERTARVALDEPLGDRRLLDEQGQPVLLVDGDRLLRPGDGLPEGWSARGERAVTGRASWSFGVRGPDGAWGDLQVGAPELGRQADGDSGYRELARPQVRGVEGVLGAYDDASGNHVLRWSDDGLGFALQVLGPLPDPQVLVEVADALEG